MPFDYVRTPARTNRNVKRSRSSALAKKSSKRSFKPVRVSIGRNPFPQQLFNTLTYFDMVSFSVTTGAGTYGFRANGMFDPDYTSTGHQPLYFDQLSAVYNHWTVLRSRIKITSCDVQNSEVNYSLVLDDDTSPPATGTGSERPGASTWGGNPSIGSSKIVLYQKYDAAKMFGPNPMANDNLQGTSAADPTEQALFFCQAYVPAASTYGTRLLVEIEYDVVWDELKTIAAS